MTTLVATPRAAGVCGIVMFGLLAMAVIAGCSSGATAESGTLRTTTTTVDAYGDEPTYDRGTRDEVCRDGAAAQRVGRARLAAFIAEQWPDVVDVLGYECREIEDRNTAGCDGEAEPAYSDCWSTHASGRAIDVVVGGDPNAGTPAGIELGDEIVDAFLVDRDGVEHHFARVTGVHQILWHGRCWHTDDVGVTSAADMEVCPIRGHDDHVHLTLSSDGADGRTSWYRSEDESILPNGEARSGPDGASIAARRGGW